MRNISKQLNFIFLSLSVIGIVSSVLLYYTAEFTLFVAQLFSGSIGSFCIFFALSILNKQTKKHRILQTLGYITVLMFLFCVIAKTDWLPSLWNYFLSVILLLLFAALDEKLQLTSLANYKKLMLIIRISEGLLILGTLLKISSPILLSAGVVLLLLLSISSILALFFQKKSDH